MAASFSQASFASTIEAGAAVPEFSVSTVGDIDRDGYADVLVGIPTANSNRGQVFLFCGSPSGPLRYPSWTAEGSQTNAGFGTSVGPAGDVNSDGFADVIVSAPGQNTIHVYHGSRLGLAVAPNWAAANIQRDGIAAAAGDINADGFADIFVGEPGLANLDGRLTAWFGSRRGLAPEPAWTVARDPLSLPVFQNTSANPQTLGPFIPVILAYMDSIAPRDTAATTNVAPRKYRGLIWLGAGLIALAAVVHVAFKPKQNQPEETEKPAPHELELVPADKILGEQHALMIEAVTQKVQAIKAARDQSLCR